MFYPGDGIWDVLYAASHILTQAFGISLVLSLQRKNTPFFNKVFSYQQCVFHGAC